MGEWSQFVAMGELSQFVAMAELFVRCQNLGGGNAQQQQLLEMQGGADEQVFSSEQEDAQCMQLREKIGIRQVQLHMLVSDREKFLGTIVELINQAIGKIYISEKQELRFALVFLKQSERILEYAASCGKNINKQLIINILHNQASIYQKLWELNNCTSYLEGIIYNYDHFIKETSTQGSLIHHNTTNTAIPTPEPLDSNTARIKQKLARYNLQFCAVNSQLTEHDAALVAVKKAHSLMGECINGSIEELKRQFQKQLPCDVVSMNLRISLLLGLLNFDKRFEQKLDYAEVSKNLLKCTHFSLQIMEENKKRSQDHCSTEDRQYLEYLANYSIGNIVQIVPMRFDSSEIGLVSMLKDKSSGFDRQFHPHNKIVLLSTCFFSKATELRLKSVQLFRKNLQQRKFCRQYKLSLNYHLLAVIVVALFVPYHLKYLTEILTSYQKHYNTSLLQYKTVQTESLSKIAELLNIEIVQHSKQIVQIVPVTHKEENQVQIEQKNDYNLKINFENDKLKKLDKIKSLKKITKELTEPPKHYEEKDLKAINKSKQNKTSLSNSKYQKRERTFSKNATLKKSPTFKEKDLKEKQAKQKQEKQANNSKGTPWIKNKRSPNQMGKSRNREKKKSSLKQIIDQTEQLFFCFTKKTKKTHGVASPNSQLRLSSIGSTSAKSKNSKKSILSPRAMKIKASNGLKSPKSPPKRKNIGQTYYF